MSKHKDMSALPWVQRWAQRIPATGPILDLACGSGRNLRHLLDRQQPLVGLDIDLSGIADLLDQQQVHGLELDLETSSATLPDEKYAGIIVTNYLHRPLLKQLPGMLDNGGVLIYETFAAGNEQFGRPRNPDFLLNSDELLDAFCPPLSVLKFEQGLIKKPSPAMKQRIAAIKIAG